MKAKRSIKKWASYKFKRFLVGLKRKSKSVMEPKSRGPKLNEIQKPLYDICHKLISEPTTELRSNSIDYTFHIENDNYLLIIRSNQMTHESYSISLIELNSINQTPVFVDIPFPSEFVKIIVEKFDREMHKRMKNRQTLKTTKVANRLQSILKQIELKEF